MHDTQPRLLALRSVAEFLQLQLRPPRKTMGFISQQGLWASDFVVSQPVDLNAGRCGKLIEWLFR
jgi:hypothetical protein